MIADDRTNQFVDCLKMELERSYTAKDAFVKVHGLSNFEYIVHGWEAKVVRCAEGDQAWGLFRAEKH